MASRTSKFEELIGDTEAFRLMLDGALKDLGGIYDVLLPHENRYLFTAVKEPAFRPFCRKLREKTDGEALCWDCDLKASKYVMDTRKSNTYTCHAGLVDIAVPIFVNDNLVATIFCGQVRPLDNNLDNASLQMATTLEETLGFSDGELIALWNQIPQVSEDRIRDAVLKIEKLVNYITQLGYEKMRLQEAAQKDKQRLEESRMIEEAALKLTELTPDMDSFWKSTSNVLERIVEVVGAECGMILIENEKGESNGRTLRAQATARLIFSLFKDEVYSLEDPLYDVVEEGKSCIVPFGKYSHPKTVCGSINKYSPQIAEQLDKVVLHRIRFDDQRFGILLLFMSEQSDIATSLPIQEETGFLSQLAYLIGIAHYNCKLFQAQSNEMNIRRSWLRKVTHQLLAPLHGIQGYAEDAKARLSKWQEEEPTPCQNWTEEKTEKWKGEINRWVYSFDSVFWSSHYAARLAHNLAWTVYGKPESLDLELIEDMGGLLIGCARDFQGIARERNLKRVHVFSDQISLMNGRLLLNKDPFKQAIGNILDNAVKYSKPNTEITIEGTVQDNNSIIRITNYGIQLPQNEIDNIFIDGYRTSEARKCYSAGTGIGLTVAREIIELHHGTLTAQPSTKTLLGWQTVFTINLPCAI